MTIHVRAMAQDELAGHYAYFAARSVRTADRFLQAVRKAFETLAAMPTLGSPYETQVTGLEELRSWTVHRYRNYVILYLPLSDGIDVLHVFHGSRDIKSLLAEIG